jgi:hypothetical protein
MGISGRDRANNFPPAVTGILFILRSGKWGEGNFLSHILRYLPGNAKLKNILAPSYSDLIPTGRL